MSWFLVHKQGLSLVSPEGFEQHFYGGGDLEIGHLLKLAGKIVINMKADRPPDMTHPTPPKPTKPPGTTAAPKPDVIESKSPNFSARGSAIKRIIMHYTTDDEVEGTLDWFSRPSSRVSAHYVVDRDGTIYQCVSDERKAWHAGNENDDSIGIEHVAAKGQKLTQAQSEASAALVRYLKSQYKITNANITAHRFTASNKDHTDCPGSLWETEDDLKSWLFVRASDSVTSAPVPAKPGILNVPYFSQRDWGGSLAWSICGVTSAAMVLTFWGINMNPNEVLARHGKAAGQSPAGVEGIFEHHGLKADSTQRGTWEQAFAHLRAGRPVVFNGWFTQSGHILVATAIDGDSIVCNDPAGVWEQVNGDSYSDNPKNGKGVRYFLKAFKAAVGEDGDVWFAVAWK